MDFIKRNLAPKLWIRSRSPRRARSDLDYIIIVCVIMSMVFVIVMSDSSVSSQENLGWPPEFQFGIAECFYSSLGPREFNSSQIHMH